LLYRVERDHTPVLADSLISLTCAEGGLLRDGLQVVSCVVTQRDATWRTVWGERADIRDAHREAVLTVRDTNAPGRTLRLTVRAYDDGVALRYALPDQAVTVQREAMEFRLPRDADAWATYAAQGFYARTPVSRIRPGCERPLTIELATNLVVALGEAALVDFARMKFAPLVGAPHALVTQLDGPARLAAGAESPWRVVQVASSAPQLAEANSLFLNLNAPCALADTAWIKPGKVIREMTLTTAGARRLVDFAARRRLQYVHFDAGWYGHEYDDRADARGGARGSQALPGTAGPVGGHRLCEGPRHRRAALRQPPRLGTPVGRTASALRLVGCGGREVRFRQRRLAAVDHLAA
jgi:alpha-glucosidase